MSHPWLTWPELSQSTRLWTLDLDPGYNYVRGRGTLRLWFNGGTRYKMHDVVFSDMSPTEYKTAVKRFVENLRNEYVGGDRRSDYAKFGVVHRVGDVTQTPTMLIRPEEIVSFDCDWGLSEGGTVPVGLEHGSRDRVQMRITVETLERMKINWYRSRRLLRETMLECARALEARGDGDHAIARRVMRSFMYC